MRSASDGGLKFAVVREDPLLEEALIEQFALKRPLVVASGGCTALTLAGRNDVERVTAFDFNPHQLAHVESKARAVARGELSSLGVENEDPGALHQCGAFDALFRVLRRFVAELVTSRAELVAHFDDELAPADRATMLARWQASPYWPAAFATTFNEPFLHAMFGEAATQHAPRGSYPGYFRGVFERALARDDAPRNPFLQHVLLGRYLREDAPSFIGRPAAAIDLIEGTLLDVPELDRFDLYSLSNVFDWSEDSVVVRWAEALRRWARPGSVVLVRQLNNQRDLRSFFGGFRFDEALGSDLLARDRSAFYERIVVAMREEGA